MSAEVSPGGASNARRRTPPRETIEWARRAIGGAARLSSVEPLGGGQSHANHVLRFDRAGSTVEVVLRRWVRADWQETDPEFSPAQEAATYGLLASAAVPAPGLLAADPEGRDCDVPAILLTRSTGARLARPTDRRSFLAQLADALRVVHAVDPERAARTVPAYRPYYERAALHAPAWAREPATWERAIETATGPPPGGPAAFIHRDYHPGNTLWAAGMLTGIVDWTTASWGAPAVDVAHMRVNLAMSFGVDVADEFLAAYRDVVGGSVAHDPYWDLRVAVDFLPDLPAGRRPSARVGRLDEFVARRVASLWPSPAARPVHRFDTLSAMIRLALLGFWHVHATDYVAEAEANPDTEIVAAWDDDAARGRAGASDLGVPFEEDLAALLARPDVDGVIVTTKTSAHPEVIGAAVAAGKHVYTEKVLALTPADARGIVEAAGRAGVVLTVSLPRLSHGYTLAIREILASGVLGQVTQVRCRLSHDGALGRRWLPARFFDPGEAGGGALVDLGCHPLYLTRLFLGGMPESVAAGYGRVTGQAVDDNAVAILRHASGALGIAETGFVNPSSPFTIEIHGTAGSLLYGTPEPRLLVRTATAGTADGDDGWDERPIPDDAPTPFERWVTHIRDGTRDDENVPLALDLTTLVDAADRSALTGRAVAIDAPEEPAVRT